MSYVLMFTADDGGTGNEVWFTNPDGTSASLLDLNPGNTGSNADNGIAYGNQVFFEADNGVVGDEVFVSDGSSTLRTGGSTTGTGLFADIYFGPTNSNPDLDPTNRSETNISDGNLFFSATQNGFGNELYMISGSNAPVMVRDINPGANSSNPDYLVDLNGTLLFRANDGTSGTELYRTDGTEIGTQRILDIYAGANSSSPIMYQQGVMGNQLLFSATTATAGRELWITDGTASGTTMVRDIYNGANSSSPDEIITLNGQWYFSANDGSNGSELWRSDGTEGGTNIVRDIYNGANSSNIDDMVVMGNQMFFTASTASFGNELWVSDGTSSGTMMVRDIRAGANSSNIDNVTVLGNNILFSASDGSNGDELWISDGTLTGTRMLVDIYGGANSSNPNDFMRAGDLVYFDATTADFGNELWVTDGTAAGTRMVQDVRVGANGSNAQTRAVIDINVAPTAATLDTATVAENTAIGTAVGTLSSTDADGDPITYTLTDDASGLFSVVGNELQVAGALDFEAASSRNITVRAADPSGAFNDATIAIAVTNVVEAPTTPTLSAASINENNALNAPIGTLASTDPEGGTLSYSLLSDAGGRFSIVGSELRAAQALDHETAETHDVTVRVSSTSGATTDQVFSIAVGDVNEAPSGIALSTDSIAENNAAAAVVGTLSATDPDDGDTLTFSLSDDASGAFSITTSGTDVQLVANNSFDFETASSHAITVVATDSGGLTSTQNLTINVTDVNEAPTSLALSANSIAENGTANSPVGTLSATDPEGRAITYTLTDTSNGTFAVNGNLIVATRALDFETASSYMVTAQAADAGGLTTTETFTINVTDVNEAPTGIALSANTVQENQATGTVIGALSATDPDGDTLTFTLGDGSGPFSVNGQGQIVTTRALDFETEESFVLAVTATDGGGLSTTANVGINVTDDASDNNLTLIGDGAANRLEGGQGNDTIEGRGENDTLIGNDGADSINGDDGSDNIQGGAGDDFLYGGSSENDLRDNIFGGDGNDLINGGFGNDSLVGDNGNDTINGGFGADTVIGGNGDDQVTGAAFGDLMFGGAGNDFLNGGFGSDRMNGGDGADRFFHLGIRDHGNDWVQDYNAAEGDTLVFGGNATAADFQVNLATTPTAGAGGVQEAFIIYRPTNEIIWALVDGAGQTDINVTAGGTTFDLVN